MSNDKHEILARIAEDLQILKYNNEERNQYIARIVYSALSMWIRISTLDEDVFAENANKVGISKIHIINSCKPFLDNMLDLYPEIYEWFYPKKDDNTSPVKIVRDRLQAAGELVSVGFNTDLALPIYEECNTNTHSVVIRGMNKDELYEMSGLAQIQQSENQIDEKNEEIFKFYGICNRSAEEETKEYVKNIKWNKTEQVTSEIFNKYSNNILSKCWDKEYELKENDLSLYKNGISDFGFIRKTNDSFFIAQISQYFIGEFEVRRFMYGLKSISNNVVIANYKRYEKKSLIELNLYNKIPNREKNMLFLLGWPAKNINDELNWVFTIQVWAFIEKVLKNLNITLQEVQ